MLLLFSFFIEKLVLKQIKRLNCSAARLVTEGPDEGPESPGEEEELIEESVERKVPVIESGVEPKSDMTTGITAAFNAFKTQLEQHFAVSTHTLKSILIPACHY